jgi:arylsulfatase A
MMKMTHLKWILSTFLVGASASLYDSKAAPLSGQPNVVVILADDMGYGDVRALNPKSGIPTPNLDRLASEGMTFTDAHSPSAVCTPTRYGLLTGRYCWRTSLKSGVLGGYSEPLLASDRVTIGTMLQSKGYRTGAVGKWHLGMKMPFLEPDSSPENRPWEGDPGIDFAGVISDSPIHHGFHQYFGVSASLDMAPYVYINNDRFNQLPTIQQPGVSFPHFVRKGPRSEEFVIDEVLDRLTQEATQFIKKSACSDTPYFLYMPLTGPHKPTQPEDRFRGATQLGEYGDFVAQVDWTVGEVMKAIAETGEMEQTLVIYTSDNGSYMFRYDDPTQEDHVDKEQIQGFRAENHRANGPWRGTKADIYEAGHHVPFFVRWPEKVEAGSVQAGTVCLTDVFATLADIVGYNIGQNEAEDSASLVSLLDGTCSTRNAPVVHHSVGGMFAIRDGRWKLILGNGSGGRERPSGRPFEKPYQLYDMVSDPAEANDLIDTHPGIAETLAAKLDQFRESGRSVER